MTSRPLTEAERANFQTILTAGGNEDLALVRTYEKDTGKQVALVCAVSHHDDEYEIVPLAVMIGDDPYELYANPAEDQQREEATS